jgi:hypothetical protein
VKGNISMKSTKHLENLVVDMYLCGLTKRQICYELKVKLNEFDKIIEPYKTNLEFNAVRNYFTGKSKEIICTEYNLSINTLNKLIEKVYGKNPDNITPHVNIPSGFSSWISNLLLNSDII